MISSDDPSSRPAPPGAPDDPPHFDDAFSGDRPSPGARASFRRVLVIDDHMDASEALELFFAMHGYEAISARDGLAGLAAAESFRPEVVLLDIDLPKLDGYETARRLRAAPWGRHLLIVAITGHESKGCKQRALDAGFDHYVSKPIVDVESFLARLNVWANAH